MTDRQIPSDWRDRMRDEYWELRGRADRLERIISRYEAGTLDFTPRSPIDLLRMQLRAMRDYQLILRRRFEVEGVDLERSDSHE